MREKGTAGALVGARQRGVTQPSTFLVRVRFAGGLGAGGGPPAIVSAAAGPCASSPLAARYPATAVYFRLVVCESGDLSAELRPTLSVSALAGQTSALPELYTR